MRTARWSVDMGRLRNVEEALVCTGMAAPPIGVLVDCAPGGAERTVTSHRMTPPAPLTNGEWGAGGQNRAAHEDSVSFP
jgi:hypothetical protein